MDTALEAPSLSVKDYPAVVKRRALIFFLPAITIFLISLGFVLFLPPVYQSTSTILIEEQELPLEYVQTTVTSFVEKRLQEISQKIMVTSSLQEIIDEYGLYEDLKGRKTREEIIEEMRDNIFINPISTDVVDRRTGRPTVATIAFTIAYSGKNYPARVHKVATRLTALFLEENIKVRSRQVTEASQFFETEIDHLETSLFEIEDQIAKFREDHVNELPEILSINIQDIHRIDLNIERAEEQVGGLQERIGDLEIQLAAASPQIADEKRLVQLRLELDQIRSTYSDDYPDAIMRGMEIAVIEKRVAEDKGKEKIEGSDNPAFITLSSMLEGARAEIDTVYRQINEYEKQRTILSARIAATPRVEQKYRAMTLERDNIRIKYDDLMQKYMEAKVAQGLEKEQKGERFTLIDPALMPEKPVKPNRPAIALIGAVLGIGAGIGLAALVEFTDDAVRDPDMLSRSTSIPVLSAIPDIETAKEQAAKKRKRVMLILTVLLIFIVATILFHYFVMDLELLWIKINRKIMV